MEMETENERVLLDLLAKIVDKAQGTLDCFGDCVRVIPCEILNEACDILSEFGR
jgi:hypothetical protein